MDVGRRIKELRSDVEYLIDALRGRPEYEPVVRELQLSRARVDDAFHAIPRERKLVRAIVVLDKSVSMKELTDATIENYNKFIAEQRADKTTDTEVTLILFGAPGDYTEVYVNRPIDLVPQLDSSVYVANGFSTALNDATFKAFRTFDFSFDRKVAYIGVVVTDGLENSSQQYKKSDVTALMERLRKTGHFSFLFLGSHPESWEEAQSYGYATTNSLKYTPSSAGIQNAFSSMSRGLSNLKVQVTNDIYASESLLDPPATTPTDSEGAE